MSNSQEWWNDSEQLGLFEERMRGINVPRRQFLKVIAAAGGAAALAACGGGSNNNKTTNSNASNTSTNSAASSPAAASSSAPAAASSATPAAGAASSANLSKNQTFNSGIFNFEPLSFDFNKDLYCQGDSSVLAALAVMGPNYGVHPDVAASWDVSPDGATYTYHFRDTKWSNGDPVTAGDFEFSYKRQLNPATGASYAAFLYDIKNAQPYNTKKITDQSMVGVKALDPKTLQITLEGPRGYWPILSAYAAALPANQAAVQKYGDKWTDPTASGVPMPCNGPFKLTSWDHNKQFTVQKNESYWNAANIKLTTVMNPIVPVEQLLVTYQNGEIDFDPAGQIGDLKRVQSDATLSKQMFKYSLVGTWYLVPSATIPPFDNVKVRLAVAHSIDRDTLAKDVYQGLYTVAYTMNPPGTPAYNPNKYSQYTSYDPKLAMQQLVGTPYEGGKNWPKITLTQRKESDVDAAAGDAIIQMLKSSLNMTIDHVIGEPKATYNEMYQGKIQLMWLRWYMDYPDPEDTNYLVWYGKTPSGHRQTWNDDTFNMLVTQAAAEQDPQKRAMLYQQSDQIIAQQAAGVFVSNPYHFALLKPYVLGMPKNKAGEYVPTFNIFTRMTDFLSIANH